MAFSYGGCNAEELDGDFERFPEGKYEFFIESISEGYDTKNNPQLEIVLKPMDYEMQSYGKVWHRINLKNDWTRINVGRFLAAVGEDPTQRFDVYFNQYKGEQITARIKHNKKGDKTYVNAILLPRSTSSGNHPNSHKAVDSGNDGWDKTTTKPFEEDLPF